MVIPLCLVGNRVGYWLGAVAGLLHFAFTIPLPMTGVCNHDAIAAIVSSHGVLIAAACLAVLHVDARKRAASPFKGITATTIVGYALVAVSTPARFGWIVFREPTGALNAVTRMKGVGGIRELVSQTLYPIVIISTIALCVIIPGVAMRKRWAFTSCVVFGAIHIPLVAFPEVGGMAHGIGPGLVWAACTGVVSGGLWMNTKGPVQAMTSASKRIAVGPRENSRR